MLLSLFVVVLTVVVVARAREAGDDLAAFLTVAVGGLLISPVSWGHHYIWIAPALVLVARPELRRGKAFWTGVVPVTLIFAVGPHWLLPGDNDVERGWEWWQQAVGNAYVWVGFAVLATLAVRTLKLPGQS